LVNNVCHPRDSHSILAGICLSCPALVVQLPRARHACHLPNRRVAHLRRRISIAFESIYFLLTLILMAVCSLREFYRLSCWGAKPPSVAVLHIAEDDELQVTTGRHPTPSWGAFSFIDHPTRLPAGSKHALILHAFYAANFTAVTFYELLPRMSRRRSSLLSGCPQLSVLGNVGVGLSRLPAAYRCRSLVWCTATTVIFLLD
jgi:hypothetical protein